MAERSWFPRRAEADAPVSPPPDDTSVKAAVGQLYAKRGQRNDSTGAPWESRLTAMYREGRPAIFGALIDIEASQCAKLPLIVKDLDGADAPDAIQRIAKMTFRGVNGETREELVERGVMLMRRNGRWATVFADGPNGKGRVGFHAPPSLTSKSGRNADGSIVKGWLIGPENKDNNAPASGRPMWVPEKQVREAWVPDPDNPAAPWTPYARCVEPLDVLRQITRRVLREVNQFLAGSRAMWWEGEPGDLVARSGSGQASATPMALAIDKVLGVMKENLNDVAESSVASAAVIPIVSPHRPEMIELMRQIDPSLIPMWDRALFEFALATPWPTRWITEGTGAGNHWSDWLMSEEGRAFVLYPTMRQFCALASVAVLRPMLAAAKIPNPDSYSFDFVVEAADEEPMTVEEATAAWEAGMLSRAKFAEVLGIDPEDMLPLPDGVSEYQFWQESAGRSTSDYRRRSTTQRSAPVAASLNGGTAAWWE